MLKNIWWIFFLPALFLHYTGWTQTIRSQTANNNPQAFQWHELEEGLSWTEADPHLHCNIGDNRISIVKVDPAVFDLTLCSAKELKSEAQPIQKWVENHDLLVAINAGMYQQDFLTSVGFMKNYSFVNQGRKNKDNTILAFNRKTRTVPPAQIIDLTCQSWEELKDQYDSFVQSIRMIDCEQKNRWGQQQRYWSTAAIAVDQEGAMLFIHSRTPWSVRDFISILQHLPLNIHNAMYLEGGPEASLYLDHPSKQLARVGSYETGFWESDGNRDFWPIPNVIGIKRK
ncbi:MAG: phosphodiester glycosidase family protein [Bacteroidota bacterium]